MEYYKLNSRYLHRNCYRLKWLYRKLYRNDKPTKLPYYQMCTH